VPERRPIVSRRDILKIGGSATLVPLASILGLGAPVQRAHAIPRNVEFKSLDRSQARLLLSVTRTLFPHDFLPDDQYLNIVGRLDAKAAADQGVASMVKAALAAFPVDFTAMDEVKREDYLRTLEGSPFFAFVYEETLVGLYDDPAVSTLLGYEGSSVEHGGYLKRGFDDISWLPADEPAVK
jgi:hypothetical protein